MAHFYGTVRGQRGEASRLGSENSGLRVSACSWQGRIEVELMSTDKGDKYWVHMRQHGSSSGWEGCIAEGLLGTQPQNMTGILPTPSIESFDDEALVAEVKRRFDFDLVLRQPKPPRKLVGQDRKSYTDDQDRENYTTE